MAGGDTGEFTFDDVLADAKLPTRSVPICLRGDLIAEWQDLERQFKQANQVADEDTLASKNSTEALQLAQQMEDLEEQMRAATRMFRLQGLLGSDWRKLLKAHPPREGDEQDAQVEFNRETFGIAALAACSVMPKMTVAQAAKLVDGPLTDGQWNTLFGSIWQMHATAVDIPFSLAASAVRAASAPKPK
ncbi:MAG: hypothetical protein ACRDP6_14680 [Actinoallomurus sp.]